MKSASVQEIKQELNTLKSAAVVDLCLRLTRFKKENKELLTYLLFEAQDEQGFVQSARMEMDDLFEAINRSNLYYARKSLRKIVRVINKYCRFSGSRQTETELRMHFCKTMQTSGIPFSQSVAIKKIYDTEIQKIQAAMKDMHEDLQYDYMKELEELKIG